MKRPRRPSFRTLLACGCCVVVLLTSGATGAEISGPARKRAANFQRPGWRLVGGRWLRPAATIQWRDLVRVEQDGRVITVIAAPSPTVEKLLAQGRIALVDVSGSPFAWQLDMLERVWLPGRREAAQALRAIVTGTETPIAQSPQLESVIISNGLIELAGRRVLQTTDEAGQPAWQVRIVHLTIVAGTGQVRLRIADAATEETYLVRLDTQADNLYELLDTNGELFRAEVRPLLEQLSGGRVTAGPLPGDFYRAFSDIAPSPLQRDALAEMLTQLADVDDAETGADPAQALLAYLGDDGVLPALRADRENLGLRERRRLDRFVAARSAFADVPPETLLADRDFLFDALSFSDARVRAAARARITEHFSVDVPADASPQQIDLIRWQTPRRLLFR